MQVDDLSWLLEYCIPFPLELPFGLSLRIANWPEEFCWEPPRQIELLSVGHMFAPTKSEPVLHMELTVPEVCLTGIFIIFFKINGIRVFCFECNSNKSIN